MIKLSEGEETKAVIRKHWLILLRDSTGLIIVYLVPLICYWYFFGGNRIQTNFTDLNEIITPNIAVIIFSISLWTLIVWAKFFGVWTDHYLDAWFITSKRIIDVEQKGLFSRGISTTRIERIQDVTVEVRGVFATLFNIGDIHVQTAGEAREFVIRGVGKPKEVKKIITDQTDMIYK